MTDKVQKIREEVEMVVNRRLNLLNGDYFDLNKETKDFTNEIMDIIDSLQKEPVSEDLEKAAKAYSNNLDNICGSIGEQTRNTFKAGAKWQKEQMMKETIDGYVIEDIEEGNGDFLLSCEYLPKNIGLVDQQKVKVIVIKED